MPLIAIVDDREEVLHALTLILKRAGRFSTEAYDTPGSLLQDMETGRRPDLIVTDLNMAGMNGIALLDTVVALYGDIPGIIITGYPEGIQSAAKRYPVLCKGDQGFFRELVSRAEELLAAQSVGAGSHG
jgi:two-component system, NtrC family, response regulator GlrR